MTTAISLSGSSQYLDLGASLVPTGSFSFSVWIYPTGSSGNPRIIANSHTDSDNKGFQFFIAGNQNGASFDVGNGSTSLLATSSAFSSFNNWYHYVGTYDATTGIIRLFQNGILLNQAQNGSLGSMAASTNHVWVGGNPAYAGDFFFGTISELKLFNKALSLAEVKREYNNGIGVLGSSQTPGILAGYHLAEGSGTTSADYSGNGYTAALTNAPSWVTSGLSLAPAWSYGYAFSRQRRDGISQVPRGVGMSGLEFAASTLPGVQGTNYTENQSGDYIYVGNTNKKFQLVRVPFLWERLQPTLGGALDSTYLGYITDNITWASQNGLKVILDCHNYGRYLNSGTTQVLGDGVLTQALFVDLWNRLSAQFASNSTVYAYDLMNEPHDLTVGTTPSTYNTTSTWTLSAQAAINQIRTNGDTKWILAELDGFAGIQSFITNYGRTPNPWWTDTASKLVYSFHYYMDQNHSGSYNQGGDTPAANLTNLSSDIMPFVTWASANNLRIHCGEYGTPNTNNDWLNNLETFLQICEKYNIWTTHWAMGSWYSSATTLEPSSSWTVDQNQMQAVGKHIGILL